MPAPSPGGYCLSAANCRAEGMDAGIGAKATVLIGGLVSIHDCVGRHLDVTDQHTISVKFVEVEPCGARETSLCPINKTDDV